MYALGQSGIHIRQSPHAHVTTITCVDTWMFVLYVYSMYLHVYIVTFVYNSPFYTENPIQVLCDHYQFLMQHMDPNEIFQMPLMKTLLSSGELHFLSLHTPIDYMKNCYILEHIRSLEASKLLSFMSALEEIDSQKHISDRLLNGTNHSIYLCTYN